MQHFYDFRLAAASVEATTKAKNGLGSDGKAENSDTSFTCFQLNDTFPAGPTACCVFVTIPSSSSPSPTPIFYLIFLRLVQCGSLLITIEMLFSPLCVTQTETANGTGKDVVWGLLSPCSGVDGASLRSLVSLHQSLIPFIFSENNHFEATYGNRHETKRGTTMFRICWQKHKSWQGETASWARGTERNG